MSGPMAKLEKVEQIGIFDAIILEKKKIAELLSQKCCQNSWFQLFISSLQSLNSLPYFSKN